MHLALIAMLKAKALLRLVWPAMLKAVNPRLWERLAFAGGNPAKAAHDYTFVWSDSTATDFSSATNDQFLVRATGGVGINKKK